MAFGFLKAPFKLITGAAKGVAKVATTVAKGAYSVGKFAVKRAPATVAGLLTAGPAGAVAANAAELLTGGGGAQAPPDIATPGYTGQVFTTTSTDRFSQANTLQQFLATLRSVLPSSAQQAADDLLNTGRAEVRSQAAKGVTPLVVGGIAAAAVLAFLVARVTPTRATA